MDISKKLNLGNIFVFLFLILFPFGQIIRIGILQPIDVIVGLGALYAVVKGLKRPNIFRYLRFFLMAVVFSWILSVFVFKQITVLYGFLYLIRLSAYFYFLIYVWNFAEGRSNKRLLLDSLLTLSVVSALFGWVQYFAFPSIRAFMVWGWDEHLYRLVGTFLDPTFLGLIIVFGLLLSINRLIDSWKWKGVAVVLFLLVSLAFTYSRASYLAFVGGLAVIGICKKEIRKLLYLILGLALLILVLPTSGNTILRITRGFSALARIENYGQTIQIFKTSPVFGVGYDNLCLAKAGLVGYVDFQSHSCSGSDSSLLFVLATTGIVGFMIFLLTIYRVFQSAAHNLYFIIFASCFTAALVHSLFSNSLFYPWVMGFYLMLLAVVIRE
jgi:O-antigen ligase